MFTESLGISKRHLLTAATTVGVSIAAVLALAPGANASGVYNPSVGYVECPAAAPVLVLRDFWMCAQDSLGDGLVKPVAESGIALSGGGVTTGGLLPAEDINIVPSILGQPSIWLIEDDAINWPAGSVTTL